ncbi:MAG: hypothetical protein EXS36_02670 [Pedosphaera sp.]|nr:hypothetical protein [Pedosphaera sp.]
MNVPFTFILGAAEAAKPRQPTINQAGRQMLTGLMPVFIIALVLVLGVMLWALFLRKNERPRREKGRLIMNDESSSSHRRRRRRRRENKRPRNPTLLETGGLPPKKPPGSPPPEV